MSEWHCVGMALCRNGVVSEWRCVRIVLCLNGVVSEWRSVGMAFCQNGDMSGYDLSGYIFYGDKQTEDLPNCITGSRVTAILLNEWILPIGGASAVEGLRSMGLPRLVLETLPSKKVMCFALHTRSFALATLLLSYQSTS